MEAARQWFAYDGANVRLEFVDPDGSGAIPAILTTRYFNGLGVDNIIAQENYAGGEFTAGAYWHLKNHLGSTTDLVAHADQGGHQNRIIYDSYGNVVSQSNAAVSSRYLYTGREFDSETGLQYYRARYYDSSTGRFLSEDPLFKNGFAEVMAGQNNLYEYVGSNPIHRKDPFGKDYWQFYDPGNLLRLEIPHTAVLVGNDTVGYTYYSTNIDSSTAIRKHFYTLEAANASPLISQRYPKGGRIQSNEKQDRDMMKYGDDNYKKYNPFTYNCTNFSEGVMAAGGIGPKRPFGAANTPAATYERLRGWITQNSGTDNNERTYLVAPTDTGIVVPNNR